MNNSKLDACCQYELGARISRFDIGSINTHDKVIIDLWSLISASEDFQCGERVFVDMTIDGLYVERWDS